MGPQNVLKSLWISILFLMLPLTVLNANAITTTASPVGGTYTTAQSVTLTCNDVGGAGCDKIYYTTDGSTPKTSSTVYSGPITISSATTLKFFAVDKAGNSELLRTESYIFLYGSISGTVTDGISGLTNVTVTVYTYYSNVYIWLEFAHTNTDANGNYTIGSLPSDIYKIRFSASGYIYDSTDADKVSVTAPNATSGINAVLVRGGSISGTITDGTNGIQGVSVYIYDANGGSYISNDLTNAIGNYTFSGLATGSYKIEFDGPNEGYIREWYNDKATSTDADTVSVTAPNSTTGIDAVLAKGGSISGTVTDGTNGIEMVNVDVYDANGSFISNTYTDSSGNYTASGLPTGSYKIEFYRSSGYLGEWYNDKTTETDADLISVTAPNLTTGVNAVLAKGGSISGTVTDGTNGIKSVSVYVYDTKNNYVSSASTDSSGNYNVDGLPTGSYKVYFNGISSGYVGEYYNDRSWSNADVISVTAPNTTSGINAVLSKGGSISGKVTDGVSGLQVWVCVYDAEGIYISCPFSDPNGNYTVIGIPTGNFKVVFIRSGSYAAEWYNNKGDFYSAESVAVTVLNDTPNIDAVMTPGQSILAFPILPVFESTTVGTAAPSQKLTVYNYGSSDLSIASISLSGANASDFSITNDPCSGTILTRTSYYCDIEIAFNPTSSGTRNATISIQSDDPDTPVLNVPLSGTATTPDTSPTAFIFTDRTNVSLNSVIVSNSITLSDINSSASISIIDGEYMINSGSWTASDGTVNSGDVVTVRQTSSSSFSTTTDTVLTIGGVSDTFSVTTTSPGTLDDTGPSYKRVDGYDLIKLSIAFGSTPEDPNWSEACNLDNTGTSYDAIDGNDLMVFGTHFGEVE